jgi:hypothetical protein
MRMRRARRRQPAYLGDLFTPPPTRPTWTNLPEAVTPKVITLLAELLRAQSARRPLLADRKEADDE